MYEDKYAGTIEPVSEVGNYKDIWPEYYARLYIKSRRSLCLDFSTMLRIFNWNTGEYNLIPFRYHNMADINSEFVMHESSPMKLLMQRSGMLLQKAIQQVYITQQLYIPGSEAVSGAELHFDPSLRHERRVSQMEFEDKYEWKGYSEGDRVRKVYLHQDIPYSIKERNKIK